MKLVPTPSQSRMTTVRYGLRLLLTLHWVEGGADAISRTIDTSRVRGIGMRRTAPYFCKGQTEKTSSEDRQFQDIS